MTVTAAPPKSSRWTRRTPVVIAVVVVLPLAALVLWFVIASHGGLDDVVGGPAPRPDDAGVAEARERGEQHVARELADVVPVASTALGGSTDLGQAAGDRCEVGVHDFSVDDDFDLSCTHGRAVVLPGDLDRFGEEARTLHAALAADGWVADAGGSSIAEVVSEYWDVPDRSVPYDSPADLPAASYTRGFSLLVVQWTGPEDEAVADYSLAADAWGPSADGAAAGPGRLVQPGGYGAVLLVSTEYFRG